MAEILRFPTWVPLKPSEELSQLDRLRLGERAEAAQRCDELRVIQSGHGRRV